MNAAAERFVVCVSNEGYPDDLEIRKLYSVLPDPKARGRGRIRVVDGTGEDYLFPARLFMPVPLPTRVKIALAPKARAPKKQRASA